MSDDNTTVRMRSVGVIHNLSVDIISINLIMETNCILALIELLRDSSADICRAAAGTIQNLSRDTIAKKCIVDAGAIDYLSDLLFASDIACQVINIIYKKIRFHHILFKKYYMKNYVSYLYI